MPDNPNHDTVPQASGSSADIEQRALRVIATKQRLPLESVRPESTFEELGIDSLDRLNILFDLEGEFDVEINDEEAKQVSTMQQMIDGIQQLVDAKAAKQATAATAAE